MVSVDILAQKQIKVNKAEASFTRIVSKKATGLFLLAVCRFTPSAPTPFQFPQLYPNKKAASLKPLFYLVHPKGIEPPASPLGGERSILLSYGCIFTC